MRDLVLILLSGLSFLYVLFARIAFARKLLMIFLVFVVLLYGVSALIEYDAPIGALVGNFRVFAPILLSVAAVTLVERNLNVWTSVLVVSVVVVAWVEIGFGYYQLVGGTGAHWSNTWLGSKPVGTFANYNSFGAYAAWSFVFLAMASRMNGFRNARKLTVTITLILTGILVMASGSRTSMLAVLMYMVFEVIKDKKLRFASFAFFAAPIAIVVFLSISEKAITGRVVDVEGDLRFVYWMEALAKMDSTGEILFGSYFGGYTAAAASVSEGLLNLENMNPHSVPILFVANYGLVLTVLLGSIFVYRYKKVAVDHPGFFVSLILLSFPYPLIEMSPVNVLFLPALEVVYQKKLGVWKRLVQHDSVRVETGVRQYMRVGVSPRLAAGR